MRNQLLRDTDWSSMAHGLEVRVPFVDATLLETPWACHCLGFPTQQARLGGVRTELPQAILGRRKTGFTTPVRAWIGISTGSSARGLRGWAADVHRQFRARSLSGTPPSFSGMRLAGGSSNTDAGFRWFWWLWWHRQIQSRFPAGA